MSRGPALLGGLAFAGVLVLAASPDARRAVRLQDDVQNLQDDLARLQDRHKQLESSAAALAERLGQLQARVDAGLPKDVRVVPLAAGGTERWSLPTGAAYVQFLRLDGERPVFTVKNGGGTAEVGLAPGESHVSVDDRGSEQRVHTTTVHRVLRDRTGAPAEAMVSVAYEVRKPL